MTKYIAPIRRVNRGKRHWYEDGENRHVPGVTSILGGGLPTPNLITWSGNATAEAAINRWDELSDMPPAQRLETLKRARYEITNRAKGKGTAVHLYAEALVQGIEVKGVPDELRPYVDNYVRFIDQCSLDPILVEVVIVSYQFGYAGTLDLIAELTMPSGERETLLCDIKTGERGVYSETALQMAAYRFADFYVDQDGNEQPMPNVDGCAAIHVTADDAQLIPTVSNREQLNMFRIIQKVAEHQKDSDGLMLPAVQWPTASTARVVWDDSHE
jgi:hypothetical protein